MQDGRKSFSPAPVTLQVRSAVLMVTLLVKALVKTLLMVPVIAQSATLSSGTPDHWLTSTVPET